MAYLTIDEINTHLYNEITNEISRSDDALLQFAIDASIDEAKGYLTAYNTVAIFNATGEDRNKSLLLFVKDIVVWHYIQLANPAVEMPLRLTRYERAIKWLHDVQKGFVNPALPIPAAPTDGTDSETYIKWGSNPKRGNHY